MGEKKSAMEMITIIMEGQMNGYRGGDDVPKNPEIIRTRWICELRLAAKMRFGTM
jgi:hypothetical protein